MRSVCKYCRDRDKCPYLRNGHESKCLDVQTSDSGYEDAVRKACWWLEEQTFQEYPGGPSERLYDDQEIEKFRKVMEEK